jgi:hypothetical protein
MRFVGVIRPWISNLLLDETLPNAQNPLHQYEPKSIDQKKTTLERMVLCGMVEPGGIEPPSASPLQAVLHA